MNQKVLEIEEFEWSQLDMKEARMFGSQTKEYVLKTSEAVQVMTLWIVNRYHSRCK